MRKLSRRDSFGTAVQMCDKSCFIISKSPLLNLLTILASQTKPALWWLNLRSQYGFWVKVIGEKKLSPE
jgi:ABC-type uncharacterized transport system permease subunit